MYQIKPVIMKRDGLTERQADDLINEAREAFHERLDEGDMPFDICEEFFGLEPDYLDDLMY
jgi:hypothetical protein